MFYGPGAGKLPTASAVVADIIDIIAHRHAQVKAPEWQTAKEDDVYPVAAYACEYGIMLQGGEVDVPALTETLGERSYRVLDGVIAFVTEAVTPDELEAMLKPCELPVIATIRLLNV